MEKKEIKKILTYLSENDHLKVKHLNKEFLSDVIYEHFEKLRIKEIIKNKKPTAIYRSYNEPADDNTILTTYEFNDTFKH